MKKLITPLKVGSLFCLMIVLISSARNSRFQQVIDGVSNDTIKEKLIAFEKEGIEKQVNTENYDADVVVEYAKSFVGTPHQMGGISKKGIDCSGLVYAVHAKVGVSLPHSSHDQARFGTIIPVKDSLQKGDLLFFYNSYNTKNFITHVGIYLGEGELIHASSKRGVTIIKADDPAYWNERYLFATRLKQLTVDN